MSASFQVADGMTTDKAIEEMVEIEGTFPIQPYMPEEAVRAKESWARDVELHRYVYNKGPAPAETWKPTFSAPTGAERERYILHWAQILDEAFKHDVADRLEAGKVRYSAIPSAEETAKSIAFHEFGHVVFNRSILKDKDIRLLRIFDRAIASGDIDAVSEYAKFKPHGREFFSEAFAMWKNGEHLPDYIVRFIKEVAT